MNPWAWSSIEVDILRTLALRVRMLAGSQIARGWFDGDSKSTTRSQAAVKRLEGAGFLNRHLMEAHPIKALSGPLYVWKVGSPPPTLRQFDAIAEQAKKRWDQNHAPIEVFMATRQTAALFGSFARPDDPKHSEATHDIHFSEVYLHYRRRAPRLAALWLGESAFPKLGFEIPRMKDPDAILVNRHGAAQRIIEFSGSYDADHLAAFHEHCAGGAAERLSAHGWCDSENPFARLYPPGGTSYELW